MSKQDVITTLEAHSGADNKERQDTAATIRFLHTGGEDHFLRTRPDGHITGSALLISENTGKILLMHHGYLKRWLQFGGHADGDTDVLNVAMRETMEESGLTAIRPLVPHLVDVDIHPIPANPAKGEGAHLHYDLRYLLVTQEDAFTAPEGHEMRWFSIDEIPSLDLPPELLRFLVKASTLRA